MLFAPAAREWAARGKGLQLVSRPGFTLTVGYPDGWFNQLNRPDEHSTSFNTFQKDLPRID